MDKQLKDAIRSLLSDIDAQRCPAPFDIQKSAGEEDQKHWFGGFGNCTIEDDGEGIVEWPNLSIMSEKLKTLLEGEGK